MAVLLFPRLCIPIIQPFLNLTLLSKLDRSKSRASSFQFFTKVGISVQNLGSLDAVGEQVAQDFFVHGRSAGAKLITVGTFLARKKNTFIYMNNHLEGNALKTISTMLDGAAS